jgi:formate dehydrogenase
VNADESEPGSFKDNEIMARVPHRFVEGCLITAYAVECTRVFVYIRGEYTGPYEVLIAALDELRARDDLSQAQKRKVLGDNARRLYKF